MFPCGFWLGNIRVDVISTLSVNYEVHVWIMIWTKTCAKIIELEFSNPRQHVYPSRQIFVNILSLSRIVVYYKSGLTFPIKI